MATKLFLRASTANGIGTFRDMTITAGTNSADNIQTRTTASGTEIQLTEVTDGTVLEWISGKSPVGGWTLSGTVTFNIWAREAATSTNVGVRARLFKRTAAGVVTEISSGWHFGSPTEMTTTVAEKSWTGTPASTAFAVDDRLIVRYYAINVGTMAASTTGFRGRFDGADAATGDSFVQITENVTFGVDYDPAGYTIFPGAHGGSTETVDQANYTMGVKFQTDIDGQVTHVRYNAGVAGMGLGAASIWTLGGVKIATVAAGFPGNPTVGWHEAALDWPANITAGTIYVATVQLTTGRYMWLDDAYATARVNGPLTGVAHATSANNMFSSAAGENFPDTASSNEVSYGPDVRFKVQAHTFPPGGVTRRVYVIS